MQREAIADDFDIAFVRPRGIGRDPKCLDPPFVGGRSVGIPAVRLDHAEFRVEGPRLMQDLAYPGMGSPVFSAECVRYVLMAAGYVYSKSKSERMLF